MKYFLLLPALFFIGCASAKKSKPAVEVREIPVACQNTPKVAATEEDALCLRAREFTALDKNADGLIDLRKEMPKKDKRFAKADQNGDGQLDPIEFANQVEKEFKEQNNANH